MVADALRQGDEDKCRHCGETLMACGFECQFDTWVHTSGPRKGSHKCGKNYRDFNASP